MLKSYEVIARKWRPQVFENLVGQSHIAQTLSNALKSGRVPHALLFTGPRGTGKTSSARIFAKALRCANAENFTPCQKCADCLDISLGRHMDVIEIDGASNNGVDSIRELRESVVFAPTSGKYKIYIIDEVHMLSASAFNALLKTLEEPPAHVVFILATTEVQKIPNTILSRCQRFDFRMISQKEISQHLAKICRDENIPFAEEALWLIARQAKGSMRDGQSLLEQIVTFSNQNISVANVTASLGLVQRELINQAVQAVVEKNLSALQKVIANFSVSGCDPTLFIEDILEQWRNGLMVKIGAHKMNVPIDLPDSEIVWLEKISSLISEEDFHLLFDITLKGSQLLLRATEPRLALEMLLLKLLSAPRIAMLSQLIEQQNKPLASVAPSSAPAPIATPKVSASVQAPPPENLTPQLPKDPWQRFVETVRSSNGLLAALLEHTFIIEQNSSVLKLGLPEKMAFLMDKLKAPENMQRLNTFIESIWKQKLSVEVSLAKAQGQNTTMTPKEKVQKADQEKLQKERQMIEDHPLLKKTKSLFKTEIISIKEEKPS
ncbi:DNA polymerase III subunit gamma/tau [bacterium]|nr:DNA polymerase III subunit gamma/tau [bacterium]